MISTKATRIWTPFGYLFAEDLYIGEKVISFNPRRGVCEYDTIQSIEIGYRRCMGLGLDSKSMRQVLTPDHPILLWQSKSKTLRRLPIEERFMSRFKIEQNLGILSQALFEPYQKTQDDEDIKWSARIAATFANHRNVPAGIKHIVQDLGGYEAQLWLDTFIHWNKMLPGSNWMGTVKVSNIEVRDIVFNIAPRAGVGALYHLARGGKKVLSLTRFDPSVYPVRHNGWFKQQIDGLVFNVGTRNGNVLAKSSKGTFLVACNQIGE